MSSHHIIREKQEPALLIMDLEGFDSENLGQLLEWSPTVIVSEAVYGLVVSLGIKVDVIISFSEGVSHEQEHTKILNTNGDELLSFALNFLSEEEYPAVNVVNKDVDLSEYFPFLKRMDIVVLSGNKKVFPIKSGFSKWKQAGEKVQVFSSSLDKIHTSGLRFIDQNYYVTESDGFYCLNFDEDYIFIGEEL